MRADLAFAKTGRRQSEIPGKRVRTSILPDSREEGHGRISSLLPSLTHQTPQGRSGTDGSVTQQIQEWRYVSTSSDLERNKCGNRSKQVQIWNATNAGIKVNKSKSGTQQIQE
jgi:hypothetical protein